MMYTYGLYRIREGVEVGDKLDLGNYELVNAGEIDAPGPTEACKKIIDAVYAWRATPEATQGVGDIITLEADGVDSAWRYDGTVFKRLDGKRG